MQAFKTYRAALKAANGRPIVRIGYGKEALHIVGDLDGLTSVETISGQGHIVGQVSLSHLERLGNANWAIGHKGWDMKPGAESVWGDLGCKSTSRRPRFDGRTGVVEHDA